MIVPNHLPNKIPEISKIGDPKPSSDIQTTLNKKNSKKFK